MYGNWMLQLPRRKRAKGWEEGKKQEQKNYGGIPSDAKFFLFVLKWEGQCGGDLQ